MYRLCAFSWLPANGILINYTLLKLFVLIELFVNDNDNNQLKQISQ